MERMYLLHMLGRISTAESSYMDRMCSNIDWTKNGQIWLIPTLAAFLTATRLAIGVSDVMDGGDRRLCGLRSRVGGVSSVGGGLAGLCACDFRS